jgi:nitrate/TMAO reductase-like tetraheme cytochrome c subunit
MSGRSCDRMQGGVRDVARRGHERRADRRKRVGLWTSAGLVAAGVLVGLLLAGGGAVAVHHTDTTDFCTGCHVYDRFAESFEHTQHQANLTGVQVGCVDCHVPGDSLIEMLWTKSRSGTRAFWAYYVTGLDTPAEFEAARPRLQADAHAWFVATDSRTCRTCHEVAAMDLQAQRAGARASHQAAAAGRYTCVDCHSDVPHGKAAASAR